MLKKTVAFGLSLLGLTGCSGNGDAWLSNTDVELYENHHGIVYQAILDSENIDNTLFSLEGRDASAFTINAQTGEIQFKQSPDFETPQDYTRDNSYEITVVGTSSNNSEQRAALNVNITVKDAQDLKATKLFPLPNSYVESNGNGVVPLTVNVEDLGAPVFFPDDWQAEDLGITRFFDYPLPFYQFEPKFSEDALAPLLDPTRYSTASTEKVQLYYRRKFLPVFETPILFHYGYVIDPANKITINYSSTTQEGVAPVELEWQLNDQLSSPLANFIEQPRHIAVNQQAIYFASDSVLWRMNRDGSELTQIYGNENLKVEKLAVLDERVFVLLRETIEQRWLLTEVLADGSLVGVYHIEGLTDAMLGSEYDVEILYLNSDFTTAFLPKDLCRENQDGEIETAMYRFNSMGMIDDTTLYTTSDNAGFSCQDGHLVGSNSTYDLEYGPPNMSYNWRENILYYWGQRYSEDQVNGILITGDGQTVAVASEYWLDEGLEGISEFQHFSRTFNERMSIYIKDGALHVANGHITDEATRLSNDDYWMLNYAVDASSDLIYSVGYWGRAQGPTLAVHHLYSGAASYIPLVRNDN